MKKFIFILFLVIFSISCNSNTSNEYLSPNNKLDARDLYGSLPKNEDQIIFYRTARDPSSKTNPKHDFDKQMPNLTFQSLEAPNSNDIVIEIFPDEKRQTMLGIGGAVTESGISNINLLTKEKQKEVYDAYFSDEGSRYTVSRVPIGSCDFSLDYYDYCHDPSENSQNSKIGDPQLTNFSIDHDKEIIIPAIKKIQSYYKKLTLFSAPWSPPAWMKKITKEVEMVHLEEFILIQHMLLTLNTIKLMQIILLNSIKHIKMKEFLFIQFLYKMNLKIILIGKNVFGMKMKLLNLLEIS